MSQMQTKEKKHSPNHQYGAGFHSSKSPAAQLDQSRTETSRFEQRRSCWHSLAMLMTAAVATHQIILLFAVPKVITAGKAKLIQMIGTCLYALINQVS